MADAQNTKLKYKRGTCFGCRKCLYCGIDLQQQKCKCTLTKPPHRNNRTDAVKYAYTRIFNPNWTEDQVSFIQEKVSKYTYSITLNKAFNLSLCSRCNSILSRLKTKKIKNSDLMETETLSETSQDIKLEPEVYDLTVTETESIFQNSSETFESDENNEEKSYFTDDDFEYEFQYGIFIKLDGKFQPTKWYKIIVSEIDELLAKIHANVIALIKDDSIEACDYSVTFKSEKALGAGTQLVDTQDFQKFCLDYHRFSARNINMEIFITINSQYSKKNKGKQKVNYIKINIFF
jgi:hypothetical protein